MGASKDTKMKTALALLLATSAASAQDDGPAAEGGTPRPSEHSKAPVILHGTIGDVEGKIIVLQFSANTMPNGRQVDISWAAFENESGDVVKPYHLKNGDQVIVVIDPNAPRTWRPTPKPGKPMPMIIRVLPLKALAIERVSV